MPSLRLAVLASIGAALLVAGCSDSPTDATTEGGERAPEPSLAARLAVPSGLNRLDPLRASTPSEQLVSRQIFEPLTARLRPPFGASGVRRGPARQTDSGDGSLWEFQLRPGVSFQDGEPLDADAVIENVERWLASGVAAELVPELVGAFSPAPGRIRFQLSRAVGNFPARLDQPQLGLVSPAAIRERGTRPVDPFRTGTGPFELRELGAGEALLAGSGTWWGTELGLGPGVERLELSVVSEAAARVARLESGSAEVAWGLSAAGQESVEADPLLTSLTTPGGMVIGFERSVRGLDPEVDVPPLAGLWLTDLR